MDRSCKSFAVPLENLFLERITAFLTNKDLGVSVVNGKLEAYSCVPLQPSNRGTKRTIDFFNLNERAPLNKTTSSPMLEPIKEASESPMPPPPPPPPLPPSTIPLLQARLNASMMKPGMVTAGEVSEVTRRRSNSVAHNSTRSSASFVSSSAASGITLDQWTRPYRRRASSLGDLSKPRAKRLLLDFIQTLDNVFDNDYDFEITKPEQFVSVDINTAFRIVHTRLGDTSCSSSSSSASSSSSSSSSSTSSSSFSSSCSSPMSFSSLESNLPGKIWQAIDEVIHLSKCEIFSYRPLKDDLESPLLGDALWSFNFFFYNEDLHRICVFTCVAKNRITARSYGGGSSYSDGDSNDCDSDCVDD